METKSNEEGSVEESSSSSKEPELKNVQAEFYRKTDKLAQENQKLSEQLAQLTNMIQQSRPSASSVVNEVEEDLEDLAFKDPKAYARKVQDKAMQRAEQIIEQRLNQQQQSNTLIMQLANDYPELNSHDSELTKKAVENYRMLSPQEQKSPLAYKAAVRDAAAELGILPKSKRTSKSEGSEFVGSGSSGVNSNSRAAQKQSELDDRTIAFAEMVGLNIKDKKVLERLKERNQRKSWGKYE